MDDDPGGLSNRDELLNNVRRKQEMIQAVDRRMMEFHIMFRDERDEAIKLLVSEAKTPGERNSIKRELCTLLGVTPQWLNKLLRGEAYRRRTD